MSIVKAKIEIQTEINRERAELAPLSRKAREQFDQGKEAESLETVRKILEIFDMIEGKKIALEVTGASPDVREAYISIGVEIGKENRHLDRLLEEARRLVQQGKDKEAAEKLREYDREQGRIKGKEEAAKKVREVLRAESEKGQKSQKKR